MTTNPTRRIYEVLFLCTGNSARSVMAEAILARLGAGRFRTHSAGSRPKGEIHPDTLAVLEEHGHPTTGLRSKSFGAKPCSSSILATIDFVSEVRFVDFVSNTTFPL